MISGFNMLAWLNYVFNTEKRLAIPIMTHPGIDMTGYNVKNAVSDGYIHFKAIKAINDNFPVSASTIIMDLTVEAEAFGCQVNFTDNEIPAIAGRLVRDCKSVEDLQVPDLSRGRLQHYIAAARLSAGSITDKPVLAGCIGPFSLAGRLFDMTEIMTAIYMEPDVIEKLLCKCKDFLIEYIKEFRKAGASGIIMAEPAAGLLSADMCDMFSSAYIKDVVQEVQRNDFLFILHNCGNTGHVTQSMISTRAKGLHFGNKIDIVHALEEIPPDVLVFGNIDPVSVFKLATPEEVKTATLSLLETTRGRRNFIISSGCDTPPGVPVDNIEAFFEAVNTWK